MTLCYNAKRKTFLDSLNKALAKIRSFEYPFAEYENLKERHYQERVESSKYNFAVECADKIIVQLLEWEDKNRGFEKDCSGRVR